MAFMESEDSLTVGAEEHEICLPMAWTSTVLGLWRALRQGTAEGDEGGGTASLTATPAPFGLGPGQIVTPRVVLLSSQLGVDEAVDALM